MHQHGVGDWQLVIGEAKNYFGVCYRNTKTITLSRPLIELNDESHIVNTILHEIAHALQPEQSQSHGKEWRAIAIQLGCNGSRCYSPEVIKPKAIWSATCVHCGNTVQKNRKPKSGSACGICCKKYNHGKYAKKYKMIYKRNSLLNISK